MAAPPIVSGEKSYFGWLVPASIALHVVAVVVMPGTRRAAPAPPPVVVEMMEPPPPPPPPKKEEPPPEPQAAPQPTMTATPRVASHIPANARPVSTSAPTPAGPMDDSPVDLTGTTLSNTGEGVAVGGGGGGTGPRTGPVAMAPAKVAAPAPARLVPPSSLARPPRAPGLDSALERNYPAPARQAGISGKAVLRVRILPDGRVGDVTRVSESYDGFGAACERTVKGARWEPPIDRDGSAVSTEITYVCRFEVRS